MTVSLLAAAAMSLAPSPQTAPADLSPLAGASLAPDCGNVFVLAGAWCVSAPLSAMDGVVEAYLADLQAKGWLLADGSANRAVLVRRKDGGGCDAIQMLAVRDTSAPATAESVGVLGFVTIPRDVCQDEKSE
jgi:hypothetical protein